MSCLFYNVFNYTHLYRINPTLSSVYVKAKPDGMLLSRDIR